MGYSFQVLIIKGCEMNGWKTYLCAVCLGLATAAQSLNWITPEQYQVIMGILASLGLAALRAGVTKNGPS